MAENDVMNEEAKVASDDAKKQSQAKKELKKSKESKRIEELTAELEKQKELLLRTAAEFDNFKRRTEKERLEVYERASAATLKNLLPVFDNVDRASAAEAGSDEYNKGIELIVKQLSDLSEKLGLVPIGTVGEVFDPNFHEAVMHIDDPSLPENSIAMVMQKGYKYGNTVIRPAMVQVAN